VVKRDVWFLDSLVTLFPRLWKTFVRYAPEKRERARVESPCISRDPRSIVSVSGAFFYRSIMRDTRTHPMTYFNTVPNFMIQGGASDMSSTRLVYLDAHESETHNHCNGQATLLRVMDVEENPSTVISLKTKTLC